MPDETATSRVAYILATALTVLEPAIWHALSAAEREAIALYADGVCVRRAAPAPAISVTGFPPSWSGTRRSVCGSLRHGLASAP